MTVSENVPFRQGDAISYGQALELLASNAAVARHGWNGADQWIKLQVPDENSKMTLPYLYISTVQGDLVPWLASQTDMLATDWFCVS